MITRFRYCDCALLPGSTGLATARDAAHAESNRNASADADPGMAL